jgi:hypothetical protein
VSSGLSSSGEIAPSSFDSTLPCPLGSTPPAIPLSAGSPAVAGVVWVGPFLPPPATGDVLPLMTPVSGALRPVFEALMVRLTSVLGGRALTCHLKRVNASGSPPWGWAAHHMCVVGSGDVR